MARALDDQERAAAAVFWWQLREGTTLRLPERALGRRLEGDPEYAAVLEGLVFRARFHAGILGRAMGRGGEDVTLGLGPAPAAGSWVADVLVPVRGSDPVEYRTARIDLRPGMSADQVRAEIESSGAALSRRGTGELDTSQAQIVAVYG